jgi:hypothetical protein
MSADLGYGVQAGKPLQVAWGEISDKIQKLELLRGLVPSRNQSIFRTTLLVDD